MPIDVTQLLRDLWHDVPDADEATARHAYAYAVRERSLRGRFARSATPAWPRLAAVAVAGAALLAGAGFGVNALLQASKPSTQGSGPTGMRGPTGAGGLDAPGPSVIHVHFNSSGGTLDSLDVTVDPAYANDNIELDIIRPRPSQYAPYTVVYRSQFSATTPPSAWVGSTSGVGPTGQYEGPTLKPYPGPKLPLPPLSTWTGTIYPSSDFAGGCQSGLYVFQVEFTPAHSRGGGLFGGDRFSCSDFKQPTWSDGPTGNEGPTGH